jgi:hypothetical protein
MSDGENWRMGSVAFNRNCDITLWSAACSATWNLGTNSAFALGRRKTTENPKHEDRLHIFKTSVPASQRTLHDSVVFIVRIIRNT